MKCQGIKYGLFENNKEFQEVILLYLPPNREKPGVGFSRF